MENMDAMSLYGVFGHPVMHSLSPYMQNAAFAALGIKAVYMAFDVAPDDLGAAVAAIKALGLAGVNITIPHKLAIAPLLDEVAGDAAISGSVNTIVRRGARLIGYSTDGEGFVRALREETGFDPRGKTACLLGSGGAAASLAVSLTAADIDALTVVTRQGRLDRFPHLQKPAVVMTYEQLASCPAPGPTWDIIVNCTPLGMWPLVDAMPPLPAHVFGPGVVAADLIYKPRKTKFLLRAEAAGAAIMGGLPMLVWQGAGSFELWTGKKAPLDVMRRAVEALSQD